MARQAVLGSLQVLRQRADAGRGGHDDRQAWHAKPTPTPLFQLAPALSIKELHARETEGCVAGQCRPVDRATEGCVGPFSRRPPFDLSTAVG